MSEWHLLDDDLRHYAAGRMATPQRWSVEQHLGSCRSCRCRLGAVAHAVVDLAGSWARLDVELDAPVPGPLESALRWFGVRESTARLLAATPVLRASWLGAVAVTLLLVTLGALAADSLEMPLLFLGTAPLLPLVGVALSFGPRVDPTYELTVVAPISTLRLLLLRSAAALSTTGVLTALASLALPRFGLVTLAWVVPALALTLACLALTSVVGPALAATAVGGTWIVALAWTAHPATGDSVLFTSPGQLGLIGAAAVAVAALIGNRSRFDPASRRHSDRRSK